MQNGLITYSGPILDGRLVTETVETAYKAGRQHNVSIIIGSNSAEVPSGFVNANSKEELLSLFGNYKEEATSAYDATGLQILLRCYPLLIRIKFGLNLLDLPPERLLLKR